MNRIVPHLKEKFSGRKILICREMTKYFEEYIRTDIDKLDLLDLNFKGELMVTLHDFLLFDRM